MAKKIAKRNMTASERLVHELKVKINRYKLFQIFIPWEPGEFGKVDQIVEKMAEWDKEQKYKES